MGNSEVQALKAPTPSELTPHGGGLQPTPSTHSSKDSLDGLRSLAYLSLQADQRAFMRQMLTACPTAAVIVEDGCVMAANAPCLHLLEQERQWDLVGCPLSELVVLQEGLTPGTRTDCYLLTSQGEVTQLSLQVSILVGFEPLLFVELQNETSLLVKDGIGSHEVTGWATTATYTDPDTSETWSVSFEKPLGAGAGGTVYEGTSAGATVAVKFICYNTFEKLHSRRSELSTLKSLSHPNIVRYLNHCLLESELTLVLVLEYADMGSLQCIVARDGPLHTTMLHHCLLDALHGLQHLHTSRLVHRDIKPGNLLLFGGHPRPQCKLTDFGSAIQTDWRQTSANSCLGTPAFVSPEQVQGKATSHSDVWSMALTAIFLSTGQLPYPIELCRNPFQLVMAIVTQSVRPCTTEVPPQLTDWIRFATVEHSTDRPSAQESIHMLEEHFVSLCDNTPSEK
eukprot:NODE_1531_length_1472_cov_22.084015_g1451_i0.p1 GENE.NODE_1531_length_1472_cov_22.084015_g1451_i0~~NODE_1531_length_1472_cov_22.084015_g1451_i0.p1  ORF type:complete len:467 (+),score=104.30 NODE_1531_length_1472_cov_22.084015_g1451_i0:43-1401(+)